MLRHAISASAVLLFSFHAGATAQEPPPVAETYSEQIEVRVVEVEVTVRDRDGLPVTGLDRSDFRLFVDGRPVAIDYFSELRPAASPGADALSGSGDGSAAVEQLPVNVLIYIDEEFSLEIDLERVLAGMEKQLMELRPQDRVAVVAWDGHRLEKLLDWTAPGAEVSATLASARQRPSWGLRTRLDVYGENAALMPPAYASLFRAGSEATFDPVALSCTGYAARGSESCAAATRAAGRLAERIRTLGVENRIDRTARAVAAATRSFRAPEGRRILALLSGGWANGWRNPENRLVAWDPILDVADELRYSIYAVDVPGMSNVFLADASRRYDEPRIGFVTTPAHHTLRYLAEVTGGEALISGERRHVFARVAREASSYYSLAFTAELARDDASHTIDVEVLRGDLEVRNRRTYRDLSVSTELDYALEAALLDGTSGGGPTLAASLGEPVREKLGRVLVPLRVAFGDEGSAAAPRELELRVAAVDKDGRRVLVGPVPVTASADGTIEMPLRLRRTSHDLAVSLHDRTSGESRMASLRLDP